MNKNRWLLEEIGKSFFPSILAACTETAHRWSGMGLQGGPSSADWTAGCSCTFTCWATSCADPVPPTGLQLDGSSWCRKAFSSCKLISPFSKCSWRWTGKCSLSRYGSWSSQPVESWGPILVALTRSFTRWQVSCRSWLTQWLPWGLIRCLRFVHVLWNLFTLVRNVVCMGPSWTLKRSSCMLDEEGIEFMWVQLSERWSLTHISQSMPSKRIQMFWNRVYGFGGL